ncbi:D-3-phosphoglycerate dehydrogenase [Cytobacillus firmus]|uniref:D-3-phosphoglycerate dehydrogenase n=2 Tax=Cytobacillus TaxID=2675230 RepID=A0A366JTQ6_CYTFI|nr:MULTISPECIES: C-terminal binding protein [Cytobacillus]RBP91468.1 D-3-phosphoglycerate dehydrogenase [Cytobacillus firmus]TDX41668.1 D-3-phosphoglycerate dehydrogenase [Cytobacillus oceanisediminis]
MAFKVLLTDYEFENLKYEEDVFAESGLDIEFIKAQCKTEEDVIEQAKDADAILNQYAPISRRVIESLEKAKVISRYGVGVNTIDLDAANKKGITVANVPDYGMEEVSNHALALLLAWARKVTLLNNEVKKGNWDFKACVPIHRFNNQTVGVLGFGRIPRRFIEKVKPLGFKLAAYDPFVSAEDMAAAGVQKMELDEIIREADYLSLHVPLIKDTFHLLNAKCFSQMKKSAVIINTARGPIIDEKALIEALEKGVIAGAALDVTEEEPISIDSPLLQMENVIITPHSAWYSEEAMVELRQKAAKNIVQVIKGEKTPYALT